jgi:hypothetical protein
MTTTALVCGSARCLWEDLTLTGRLEWTAAIVAVNVTAQFLPRVTHIASLHGEFPGLMRTVREHMDLCRDLPPPQTHSNRPAPGIDRVWDIPDEGSSALFAVRVALGLGYERVICCGVPLDSLGRFYDDPRQPPRWEWGHWQGADYRRAWSRAAANEFEGRVRSCSGWTRALLGGPDGLA